jgi:hypothetical protein
LLSKSGGLFTKRSFPNAHPTSTLFHQQPQSRSILFVRHCEIAIAVVAMPRTTRATAKAEAVHEDDTAATTEGAMNMSTRSQRSREPLRPLTPNSVDSVDTEKPTDQDMASKKKGKKKAKGGKKNAKKTKTKTNGESVNHPGVELDSDGDGAGDGNNLSGPAESEHGPDNAKGMCLPRGRSHMTRLTRNSQERPSDF